MGRWVYFVSRVRWTLALAALTHTKGCPSRFVKFFVDSLVLVNPTQNVTKRVVGWWPSRPPLPALSNSKLRRAASQHVLCYVARPGG